MLRKSLKSVSVRIGVVVAFVTLGCSSPAPTPDLLSYRYSCEYLSELAIELSRDEPPYIVEIYRLRHTLDTPKLTECEGSAEWSNNANRDIIVWAEERSDGDVVPWI